MPTPVHTKHDVLFTESPQTHAEAACTPSANLPLTVNVQLAKQHPVADIINAAAQLVLQIASAVGTCALAISLTRFRITPRSEQTLQSALEALIRQR